LYRVRRTRLDDKAPAAGAADEVDRHILIDDRHITDTGAIALELVLNALPPTEGSRERASKPQPKSDPGKAQQG
jgi:hypothetical protein